MGDYIYVVRPSGLGLTQEQYQADMDKRFKGTSTVAIVLPFEVESAERINSIHPLEPMTWNLEVFPMGKDGLLVFLQNIGFQFDDLASVIRFSEELKARAEHVTEMVKADE